MAKLTCTKCGNEYQFSMRSTDKLCPDCNTDHADADFFGGEDNLSAPLTKAYHDELKADCEMARQEQQDALDMMDWCQ